MAARTRRSRAPFAVVALLVLVASLVVATHTAVEAAETPRRGGVLLAVIGADPPSLDAHQESTFATLQLVAPLYSTLLQFDPYNHQKIIGDAATEWKISPDALTYTFRIRQGIRFHDGSSLTATDVKATYDKIVFPPPGVRSIRKHTYTAVASIEAPDASTVVFKLKFPSAKVVVQKTPMIGQFGIGINNTLKPFTDIRVRKALMLGIDRYTGGRVLYPLNGLRDVGGLMRPGTEWAIPEAELHSLPGYGKDVEKNRADARRLLAEAGYPNGFKVVLKNRNVKVPYQDWAVYVIQEWRKIGIEAENRPLESATWYAEGRDQGNFELIVLPFAEFMDDPDLILNRFTTGAPQNWGRFSSPAIDDLFSRQSRALDPTERRKLVHQLQKIVLENAYYVPGLWWTRNVVHWAKVKNYVAPPSHYTNQKLQDVWLAED